MSIVDSSFVFLVAGIKKMAGTILVYVYAALFLPCSLRVALFFFLFFPFLGFSLVFWVGSSSLFFSLCVISFSGFLLCFCSSSASLPLASALLCLL